MEKSTPLWCEDCRFVSFETGLGKPMLTLNDPNGLKNSTNVYSIHLELRMALPCQISTGKWKYVNPCLDFLGIPDQRTAYVKRQARPRWTYVRRSSVTLDLLMGQHWFRQQPGTGEVACKMATGLFRPQYVHIQHRKCQLTSSRIWCEVGAKGRFYQSHINTVAMCWNKQDKAIYLYVPCFLDAVIFTYIESGAFVIHLNGNRLMISVTISDFSKRNFNI